MGRIVENPCKEVVSFRVTGEERRRLQEWAQASGKSLTAFIREALALQQAKYMDINQRAGESRPE